jgi:hypothetical protein
MQRPQALGLIVLMCLTASTVNGAESRKKTVEELKRAEQQRQAEEAARQAEALKQQAQAELEEAQRKKKELEQQIQAQQQQLQQQQQQAQAEEKSAGPEPKLNIPIRYFVYTALFSGLGYATGFLSRGPERDLRDPAKHPTPDKTLSLYRRARYGGLISKGFYSLSGAFGAYATYKTQSAVREYLTAKAQQSAALQRKANQRLAQAQSPEEKKDIEVANTLLLPAEPVATELLVMPTEPPPLQAGFFLSPAGDASVSLSVSF